MLDKDDIERLIRTAIADRRYWSALVPYDPTIRRQFERNLDPASWSGLTLIHWYASMRQRLP